jgi:hypothetical protein
MRTITIEIAQNEDYLLLLALLKKFNNIIVSEKRQPEEKTDMSQYWNCLSTKQSIEEIDQQLDEMRNS